MKDTVAEFRKRRENRILQRLDADDGKWVTTKNGHKVHINEEGVPDKGNINVIAAMNKGSSNDTRVKAKIDTLKKTKKGKFVLVSTKSGYPMTATRVGDDEWEITYHDKKGKKLSTSPQKAGTETVALLSEVNSGGK